MKLMTYARGALLALGPVHFAPAADITTTTGPGNTFEVSATDLINRGQDTLGSPVQTVGSEAFGSSLSKLNDGVTYDGKGSTLAGGNSATGFCTSDRAVVLVTLSGSATGYDISSVISLTAYNDPSRVGQEYDLSVHTVGAAPGVFVSIANPNFAADGKIERQVIITGTGKAPLASAVDQLQFTFRDALTGVGDGNRFESVYHEIDVLGKPHVADE